MNLKLLQGDKMTEEQYRNLKIDEVVFRTEGRLIRRLSSQLSNPADTLKENDCRWTNDLSGVYLSGSEGLPFKDIEHWEAIKYLHENEIPDWFKIDMLNIRLSKLEHFAYSRLRS